LLVRDDDSSVSDDDSVHIYKHIGFNTEKCGLEIWADEMIEYCEEELKKEKLEAKKKRKKKKQKQKNKTVNKTVESNITLKKDSIPTPPFYFANVGLETAAASTTKWQIGPNTFLADSGASSHMGHCDAGMFDFQEKTCGIKVGDGNVHAVTKIGN